jgi:histidinol-phosphate aminotransferase
MPYVRPNIAAMTGYAPGEQPQAGKFVKLNTNENPYPHSPAVTRAIQQALEQGLSRYPDPLATGFRTRAADLLGVGRDWILCGNGSDDILTIVLRAFVGEGQQVRSPHPSYILYNTLVAIQGAEMQCVPFQPDWTLPPALASSEGAPKLVFLANPNSPSGTCLAPEVVLELARQLPCPLLVDEAYADFAESNCISLVHQSDKILVSRSLSKSYSLAGLRFGFLVGQPHVIAELNKVKDSYNCDTLAIAGATAAIHDQEWLRQNRRQILATRKRMQTQLEQIGFSVQPSQANFVWCTRPSEPVKPIYETLKSQRILVRYMDYSGWGDGLRITVGTEDQVDVCLQQLRGILG